MYACSVVSVDYHVKTARWSGRDCVVSAWLCMRVFVKETERLRDGHRSGKGADEEGWGWGGGDLRVPKLKRETERERERVCVCERERQRKF